MEPIRNRFRFFADRPELSVQQSHPLFQGQDLAAHGIVAGGQEGRFPAGDLQTAVFHILLPGLFRVERDPSLFVRLVNAVKEMAVQHPDRSDWGSFCGSYEWEDYKIDIRLKGNDLFAVFSLKNKAEPEEKLFPLGEKTFALKTDTSDMVFVDGGLILYGIEGKKKE